MEMLFPYFVCRLATIHVDALKALKAPIAKACAYKLAQISQRLGVIREQTSYSLFDDIGTCEHLNTRRLLVECRRSLYNERLPTASVLGRAKAVMSQRSQLLVDEHVRLLLERNESLSELDAAYFDEIGASRNVLCSVALSPWFQRALHLSSPALFSAQRGYYLALARGRVGAKERRVEKGLLRYLLRASTKATPFSTFCAVTSGVVCRGPAKGPRCLVLPSSVEQLRVAPQLNRGLLNIIENLLDQFPDIRAELPLTLNPTLSKEGTYFRFLAVSGTRETFQRLERNDTLDRVVHELARSKGLTMGQAGSLLEAHQDLECTHEEATLYVERLIQIGLLHRKLDFGDCGYAWDRALEGIEAVLSNPTLARIVRALTALREASIDPDNDGRSEACDKIDLLQREVVDAVAGAGKRVDQGLTLREDAYVDSRAQLRIDPSFQEAERDVLRLLRITRALTATRGPQATMRAYFDSRHSEEGASISVLEFYESYYRDHFKEHLFRAHQAARGAVAMDGYQLHNPLGVPYLEVIGAASRRLAELLRSRLVAAGQGFEAFVDLGEIEEAVGALASDDHPRMSVAFVGEILPQTQSECKHRLLLDHFRYGLGFGRLFSRWLFELPGDFLASQYAANDSTSGVRYAEIGGDQNHNANLHPQLVPWEIAYPGCRSRLPGASLSLLDLHVTRSEQDANALWLIHVPSGDRVVPLDLGFLSLESRPPLYQLLVAFSPPSRYSLPIPAVVVPREADQPDLTITPSHAVDELDPESSKDVTYRPRVVIGHLVVSRRQWRIRIAAMPLNFDLRESERFARLLIWYREMQLPTQFYARFQRDYVTFEQERLKKMARVDSQLAVEAESFRSFLNDRKPQFIDLECPLHTHLLLDMLQKTVCTHFVIEECFPDQEAREQIGDRRFVAEQILQFDLGYPQRVSGDT